uniref:cGMP-dependent protein kinase n=1 Tax=Lotharella globosa TaxID=91324 RepID=A0A7S3ZEV3_9EUKA|mmetsp:Transcript_31692/g.61293  ORF Transcript_31692/g.61293 Transcript_31692/m.61293 type:complete len:779 (-) Transcript_31692:251-2587(-)
MGNKGSALKSKKGKITSEIDPEHKSQFLQALRNVPLLGRLNDNELLKLGEAFEVMEFKLNQDIIRQGEKGNGFYIIQEGKAKVMVKKGGKSEQVAELKVGDYLGERALLDNAPRAATVTATAPTICLYWSGEAFYKLFTKKHLNIKFAKRVAISAETMGSAQAFSAPADAVREKKQQQKDLIQKVIESNVLFRGLHEDHATRVIEQMYRVNFSKGEIPIKQGDRGDRLYVVETGLFEVRVKADDNKERVVAQRGAGTLFGELALMYNAPRAATVVALTDAVTWVVDRFTFRRVLKNVSEKQLQRYRDFLKKVSLLAPLTEVEREKIAEALEEVSVPNGTVIMRQGQKGNCMYIIGRGEVVCEKDGREVARYGPGDYFGERALLKADSEQKRAATVTAVAKCRLLKLSRNAVFLLLGPVEDIMKQRVKGYDVLEAKVAAAQAKAPSSPVYQVPENPYSVERPNIPKSLADFKILGTLGRGSFGHVQLVEDKSGKTYALKAVSKTQIVETGQKNHIISEKRVMERLSHPFCIKLFGTYHDKKCIYLLLEPSMGGELFTILRARMFFDDDTARFYAGCVVLAFEYMHSMDIVYRDLKPENLLLDTRGYLKVTDFGFAKEVHGRTHTLCGTPDYLAPEIVQGKGHGKGVDWWTLGILIYEMIASSPPFYDNEQMVTYQKIVAGVVTFPAHFCAEAKSVVKKLLHPKPTKRLGVVKGGARVIKLHPWFKGFDFKALVNQKMKPPIVPKIKNDKDLSNFEDYGDDGARIPTYKGNDDWEEFTME